MLPSQPNPPGPRLPLNFLAALLLLFCLPAASAGPLIFSGPADNDLVRVATENGISIKRFDTPQAAVQAAGEGEGVLLLADGYPEKTTQLDAPLFQKAAGKKLRLYVEYPSFLPGVTVGAPRGTHWERAVIASDAFVGLAKLRILAIHGCRFVPLKAEPAHIVMGRVAGFDTAVYGLAKESYPILCELPKQDGAGDVLVATTKLSHFLTGRYAPHDAWQSIWSYVFTWLRPGQELPSLKWNVSVRPSFGAEEPLPPDVEQQALRRGIDWYFNARMLVHPAMMAQYDRPANGPEPAMANPDLRQDWPYGHRIARKPEASLPIGDGSLGVLEGFDARIFPDGTQPVRWWRRNDCNGEIAGAMAAAGVTLQKPSYLKTAGNIGDWLYFRSRMSLGDHADPKHPAYGLIGWNDTPQYCGPGSMDGYAVYYGDDDARSMLGMMLAAATLKTDRYDERLLKCLLANLRICGQLGFQPDRLDQGPLEKAGWEHFFNDRNVSYSPHYQATLWACYLWAYRHTGFDLFLQRAKTAIGMTMTAYSDHQGWINGIQLERAKMVLALAWLVRVEDTPQHRAWLRRIADDLLARQDSCGAIREEIDKAFNRGFSAPASNEAYGTGEALLIQSDGDAASDLLYTCNFAFAALHEAAAATGESYYRQAEDKLAAFLCRIQIRSEDHPELGGGWFRAFDFKRWEYWASNTDTGWGAWCIESGWSQSWITTVLALRQMKTCLWDITRSGTIANGFDRLRLQFLPDEPNRKPAAAKVSVQDLRCEYLVDPLGIDAVKARLSWVIQSERRGERQSAYQILAASTPELLAQDQGDLWDSGRVASDQSIQVEYAGGPLRSGARCHWKVRVWDKDGQPIAWSQPAFWTMGLLNPDDWQAAWIKPVVAASGVKPASQENPPAPWVRKVFTLAAAPEQAVAYVNVLGYFELYVNGQKVGDEVLAPAVSDHQRRSLYRTYDLCKFLRPGPNCVALWMDMGWYRSGPIARVQLELSVNGQPVRIGTDATWTCAPSTHTSLGGWKWNEMGGERVDARRALAGWNQVECSAGEWIPVQEVPAPKGSVVAQSCPPNRIGAVLPLAACTALGTNAWELDFGANLTGWLRLRLSPLEPGQRVFLHYADKRFQTPAGDDTPAGKIKPSSQQTFETPQGPVCYQTFNQADEFISAGKIGEEFCSMFNYHGFRYVIVEGLTTKPARGDAEALLIESDLEPAGDFACSNDLFNRIHQVNLWTLRCLDLGGYMVDCPHRERLGYGDGQVGIESLTMNRNTAAFYGKWATDWLEAQNPVTGEIPYTAPKFCDSGGGPGWGGAGCVLPWKLYLYYGDRRLLERAYEPLQRYLGFLEQKCTNDVLRRYGGEWDFIGDWVAPGRAMDTTNWPPKPAAELFNNCYRLYLWEQLERVATVLGRTDEAQRCRIRIDELRSTIHRAFFDPSQQLYVLDEQSYQLMPLMTGVVPEDLRRTIWQKLEGGIRLKNNGHLDTGMLGTYFLIQYLQETGRDDLLYTLFNQKTYPGWGYMLSQGATTLWEQWNGYWSQIHSCFTSPGGWFYQGLAGIGADPAAPGFKQIVIKPAVLADLTWVKGSYRSIHGRIVSNWRREGDHLTMDITIPANTTATVFVPAKDVATVTESGQPAAKAEGVQFLRSDEYGAVYAVGSGTYRFQSRIPETAKFNQQ